MRERDNSENQKPTIGFHNFHCWFSAKNLYEMSSGTLPSFMRVVNVLFLSIRLYECRGMFFGV